MTIHYRTYRTSDQQQVVDLIIGIQSEEFGVAITVEDQPDLSDIPDFYQQGNGHFWVAIYEDRVVGTIALLDIGKQQLALRKMFVAAAFRGSASGVAQSLLKRSHQWAIEQGVTDIYLGTIDVYQAAMRFYEKNGYNKIKKSNLPQSFPLIAVDNVFYRKHLQYNC
ncbi:GNAT family N-acetyltransferase [Marinicella litoralis]|uniref:Acetyltransferase (GNAT) family protein n=1 Tax=Marinicella litoralis TaxID=644220 RepID=A0A4R6XL62_9GAMM|nr:GNAT family N-acetyltransferase [Marinicella litoralis]TDR16778.1 acetyltransferase (GNAT) family protein [Marinicella litoralis]